MTPFAKILIACGFSKAGAARHLGVNENSVNDWFFGRKVPPLGVMEEMQRIKDAIKGVKS